PRSRRKYKVGWAAGPRSVPWVTGACALVDSNLLAELGGMDEDFFLYYEEVALCRAARDRGRRVEFDPAVEVVHLRPLQSRRVSPRLRVVTRHSKLLYFLKHRPHWEFAALARMVEIESRLRASWAALRGCKQAARAWRAVGRIARAMRGGSVVRGRAVIELADRSIATADRSHVGNGPIGASERVRTRVGG